MKQNNKSSFAIGGIMGTAIGAIAAYFAFVSADTAENQYFMQLDRMRLETLSDANQGFEAQLKFLQLLENAHKYGFRQVFEDNLKTDIKETKRAIANIQAAKKKTEAEAAAALLKEQEAAAQRAEAQKVKASKTNPIIFDACFQDRTRICP